MDFFHFDSFEESLTFIGVMSALAIAIKVWDYLREKKGGKDRDK